MTRVKIKIKCKSVNQNRPRQRADVTIQGGSRGGGHPPPEICGVAIYTMFKKTKKK